MKTPGELARKEQTVRKVADLRPVAKPASAADITRSLKRLLAMD